jgi:hypothetical protein
MIVVTSGMIIICLMSISGWQKGAQMRGGCGGARGFFEIADSASVHAVTRCERKWMRGVVDLL